jgi:hypothetical protein
LARDPLVFLRDGDIVEVEVAGIGTLRNHVVATPSRTAESILGATAV